MIHVVGRLVQKMKIVVDKPAKKPSGVNRMAPNENKAIKREYLIIILVAAAMTEKPGSPCPLLFYHNYFLL